MKVNVKDIDHFEEMLDWIKKHGWNIYDKLLSSFKYRMGLLAGAEFCAISDANIAVCLEVETPINWADDKKVKAIQEIKEELERRYDIVGGVVNAG